VDDTRAALRALLAGSASDKQFSRVGMDINVALALSMTAAKGGECTEDLFARAGHALNEAARMHREHGRYGLGNQPDREAVCEAIDLWEEFIRLCTLQQLRDAETAVLAASRAGRKREPVV
jgi:hypothetical protein